MASVIFISPKRSVHLGIRGFRAPGPDRDAAYADGEGKKVTGLQREDIISVDGTGHPIAPSSGVFPILLEIEQGTLKVVGTAFYITRYGLFLTATHVLEDVFDRGGKERGLMFGLHAANDRHYHLRRVTRFARHSTVDIALGELDNFKSEFPLNPLENMRATLSKRRPKRGDHLITYAYPKNKYLAFMSDDPEPQQLYADFFSGRYLRFVKAGEYRSGNFETSISIESGASGGPVFNAEGRICGVASAGFTFLEGEFANGSDISFAVPIAECMELGLEDLLVPDGSWEQRQMPANAFGRKISVRDLIAFGHVLFK